jgi:MFS transporter, MFS domain-containing protein family, molybdate-anion transporter
MLPDSRRSTLSMMLPYSLLITFIVSHYASATVAFAATGPLDISRTTYISSKNMFHSSKTIPTWHHPNNQWHRRSDRPIATTTSIARSSTGSTTAIHSLLLSATPRGGAMAKSLLSTVSTTLSSCTSNPNSLFNVTLILLASLTLFAKIAQSTVTGTKKSSDSSVASTMSKASKPMEIKSLQRRFLAVFWLLRCSDWLQGPYFYDVYTSKIFDGASASMALVSRLFLTGFASTAIFGPLVGRAADSYGRKSATLIFTILYSLGALSTKSTVLRILFLGRILSGIGTSLLFSAPESWLVAEAQNSGKDPDGKYLGETFSWAYAGDSIVAITAGQMAATAASQRGPTGPFELSAVFLALGGLLAAVLWGENKATLKNSQTTSIREAIGVVRADPKIMLVGAVQSLFEAAMYIFVLQWPPAIAGAIQNFFKSSSIIPPYGTIFSCFMACCLLGSTVFGQLAKMAVPTELFTVSMLTTATIAMSLATWTVKQNVMSLPILMGSFFVFEACVGMYFPSIGTLRSRYVPDSHRSIIMNLFGIPLNVLVVSVFLSIHKLGKVGALSISSGALGLATICMFNLNRIARSKRLNEKSPTALN